MGPLGKFFTRLDSRRPPGDPDRPAPGHRDSLLRLRLSIGQRSVDLAISRSRESGEDREEMAESSPPDAETRSAQPGPSPPDDGVQARSAGPGHEPQEERPEAGEPPRQDNSVSFWDALDPTEREALRSVASWRTFAAGATIMEEGERADQVIVILGGRVKVCVYENGLERVLAIRGIGQLVGERAAMEVSIRSATVIALEMIWALVVQTKDFAAFVSAHRRVLHLVQAQRYERRTEPLAARNQDPGDRSAQVAGRTMTGRAGGNHAAGHSPQPLNGENCTVFLTDVMGFGSRMRTDSDRLLIREVLFMMTQAAMQEIVGARTEDRGDGFLTVVPPNVPTARVLGQLLSELPSALGLHNNTERESARFKLRLAVNVGPVVSDMGVSGEAIIVVARLIEAPRFKQAITNSTAGLGLIASPFVYETVIRHGTDPRDVASYSQVAVKVKESDTAAWMRLFDAPLPSPLITRPAAPEPYINQLTRYAASPDIAMRAMARSGPGFP